MSSKIFRHFTDSRMLRGSMAGLLLLFLFLPSAFSLTRYKSPQFNEYVTDHAAQLKKFVSANPVFLSLLEEANGKDVGLSASALAVLNESWDKTQGIDEFVFKILKNPASKKLRDWADEHLPVLEVLVTDARGLVVAATRKTKRYDYSEREWWRETMSFPAGKIWRGKHEFDMPSLEETVSVAFTVTDPKSGQKKGVVKAVFSRAALNWAAA